MAKIFYVAICVLFSSYNNVQGTTFDMRSCATESFLTDPPTEEIRNIVNKGQRDFSVNIIKSLFNKYQRESNERVEKSEEERIKRESGDSSVSNIFISPSSIFQSLMLAYFGAAGETEAELAKTMGFSSVERDLIKKSYVFERAFQAVRERKPDLGYKLINANKVFFDRSVPLNKCVTLLLNNELGAVDFSSGGGEKARKEINKWVEGKTLDKIQGLLPPGSIDATTRMALVNAAYFKGEWGSQFQPNDTKMDNFYVKRDVIRATKFMKQEGQFNYYPSEELRAHVLQLPYVGNALSMVIILPPFEDGSLAETVSRMTPENVQGVMAEIKSGFYKADDLKIQIPKFVIEQSMDLAQTLGQLGLETLFDPLRSNLTNFIDEESQGSERVTFNSARHKSFIEVNEEGSEAAAATALFGFRSARPLFHKEFIANHPFLFFIYDEQTDIILFFGLMQDPKQT